MSNLFVYFQTIATSIRASLNLRESFIMQSLFMMLSNVIYFCFWLIYFKNFDSVRGWTLPDMACLYGIVSGSYGIFSVFFGGARYIARIITDGDLDLLIAKPKSLILQILGLKSIPSGWGDIASGVFLLIFSGVISIQKSPLLILLLISSTLFILAYSILMGSLSFWVQNSHNLSKQLFEFLLTFSNYPKTIYIGGVKFFLMTIIPSAFIGFLPVDILKNFSQKDLFFVLSICLFYLWLSVKVFYMGLRRYSSGSRFGLRGS